MLNILSLVLGPVSTNCYLVADPISCEAVVIDPAWDGRKIFAEADKRGWNITQVWLTHAHFDHFGGLADLVHQLGTVRVALHPADRALWERGGGAPTFGYKLDPSPAPDMDLSVIQQVTVGNHHFQVLHAPGHTPGLCLFHCPSEKLLFSGDLIFYHSVGRTDLPGGDWDALRHSIQTLVYSLPEETRILPGHGDETTVGEEKNQNPFINARGDY